MEHVVLKSKRSMPISMFTLIRTKMEARTKVQVVVGSGIVFLLLMMIVMICKPLSKESELFDTMYIKENKNYASEKFPKVVHQIWFNYKDSPEPPADWQAASEATKKLNPDYEFKVWTDSDVHDMFEKYFPWFLETFYSYEYNIERVDAAKYFIMQKHGGVYLDWDEIAHISFDEVIEKHDLYEKECMLPQGTPSGVTNYVMICKKQSPFFTYMTARMRYYHGWYGIPYATVMWSTGPRFVSDRFSEYKNKDAIYVLPGPIVKEYFECLFGQSWFSWDGYIIHTVSYPFIRLGVPWKWIIIVPVCVIAFVLFYLYCRRRRRLLAEQQKI